MSEGNAAKTTKELVDSIRNEELAREDLLKICVIFMEESVSSKVDPTLAFKDKQVLFGIALTLGSLAYDKQLPAYITNRFTIQTVKEILASMMEQSHAKRK